LSSTRKLFAENNGDPARRDVVVKAAVNGHFNRISTKDAVGERAAQASPFRRNGSYARVW
jgi:hypothetical protein